MRLVLLGVTLLASWGCSTSVRLAPDFERESDPCAAVECGAGATCVDGQCVPDDPCQGVTCEGRQVCVDGTCVSDRLDEDGDGFPARDDCDDHDPNIVPGSERPCETDCGRGREICGALGRWSECTAPVDCACRPGDELREPCGNCGEARRSCRDDHTWGDPGPCENERECTPQTTKLEPCGDPASCGVAERLCDDRCRWGDPSDCVVADECAPGDTQSEACGLCGVRTQVCSDACLFGPFGACEAEGTCAPGTTESQPCGNCGTETRVCGDTCQWEPWGNCSQPVGACAPGAEEVQSCGCFDVAIEEARRCQNDCTWEPWSGCPCVCELNVVGGINICVGEHYTVVNACGQGADTVASCIDGGGFCDADWSACVPDGG